VYTGVQMGWCATGQPGGEVRPVQRLVEFDAEANDAVPIGADGQVHHGRRHLRGPPVGSPRMSIISP
jgi:hypothetical protein